jgi:glycosyltransferase involved in cell wall biosynthesis
MRILAFAYACEPGRGSEPGAGWAWARMLAQQGETWVITRRDYEGSIERALEAVPERERLRFVYVELPDRFRRWQRDLRGLRVYYVLWQLAALKEARRLRRTVDFDLVWHLTWATAWYGSLAAAAGRPFVYGPVGGCVGTVWRLLPSMGWKGATYEVARMATHGIARYANPLARQSWRRADLILAQNVETRDWFPRRHRAKVRLFPNAVIREDLMRSGGPGKRSGQPTALFAGRLEPFKGVSLCIQTLVHLPDWRLMVCGTGDDEGRLRRLAHRLGVEDRVVWAGWVTQDELSARMAEADVFLFPCVHEEAGAVIVEARAAGLPVVCLDRGGPPLLIGPAGISVADGGGTIAIARRLADASLRCFERRGTNQDAGSEPESFALTARAKRLQAVLAEALPTLTDRSTTPRAP